MRNLNLNSHILPKPAKGCKIFALKLLKKYIDRNSSIEKSVLNHIVIDP